MTSPASVRRRVGDHRGVCRECPWSASFGDVWEAWDLAQPEEVRMGEARGWGRVSCQRFANSGRG